MTATLKCTNKGCGEEYSEGPCNFHSGAPVFHEGLKGWSCCSKKTGDFDEFLKIKGCTVGQHSLEKPKQDIASSRPKNAGPTRVEDGVEVYGTAAGMEKMTIQTPAVDRPKEVAQVEMPEEDPEDAVIAIGSTCKRKSCGHVFDGSKVKKSCIHHPGTPVFHEGSKGWSCCSRKVLEFDEFLKIKGCTTGNHRYLDQTTSVMVECKWDWYQTQDKVIISFFAKKASKEHTKVIFEDSKLTVDVSFLDGKKSFWETALFQPILPEESSFQVLTTKVEIILKKSNGLSWATIEPNSNITSWTTFGTTGTVGTIGAKEAIISGDAPISFLKN